MALTVTIPNGCRTVFGNKRVVVGYTTFDTSYTTGGLALAASDLGLNYVDQIQFDQPNGYSPQYDYTNSKVKLFDSGRPMYVFEEAVTVSSNVGYLKYPAAFVNYVAASSTTATPYLPVIAGVTPTTGQVAIDKGWNLTTGVFTRGQRTKLTFAAGDTVTSCVVTYITQACKDVVDNLGMAKYTGAGTDSAVVTYGATGAAYTTGTPDTYDLGVATCAVQLINHYTGSVYQAITPNYHGSAAAAGEGQMYFTTTTQVLSLNTQHWGSSTHIVWVEYVKSPGAGNWLTDNLVTEQDLTPSSDVITVTTYPFPFLYGIGGCFPGATTKPVKLIGKGATISTTATYGQWTTHQLYVPSTTFGAATMTLGSNHSDSDHIKPTFVYVNDFNQVRKTPLEIPNGENVAFVTTRFFAIGS